MIGIFKRLESDNLPRARSVDKKIAYRPKQQSPILHFFILGFELEPCLLDQVLGIVPVLGFGGIRSIYLDRSNRREIGLDG